MFSQVAIFDLGEGTGRSSAALTPAVGFTPRCRTNGFVVANAILCSARRIISTSALIPHPEDRRDPPPLSGFL